MVIFRADGSRDIAWLVATGPPDLGTVNTLARLQLACRRGGDRVRLEKVSRTLAELLELTAYALSSSGSPNSGKSLSASRKEWIPEIRSPEISSTTMAHGT